MDLYKLPTRIVDLFQQKIIRNIIQWLKYGYDHGPSLLYLTGPIGCGKTFALNLLLKKYNVIQLENLGTLATGRDSGQGTPLDFKQYNIENKENIILFDNVDLKELKNIKFPTTSIRIIITYGEMDVLDYSVPRILLNSGIQVTHIAMQKPSYKDFLNYFAKINTQIYKVPLERIIEYGNSNIFRVFENYYKYTALGYKIRPKEKEIAGGKVSRDLDINDYAKFMENVSNAPERHFDSVSFEICRTYKKLNKPIKMPIINRKKVELLKGICYDEHFFISTLIKNDEEYGKHFGLYTKEIKNQFVKDFNLH